MRLLAAALLCLAAVPLAAVPVAAAPAPPAAAQDAKRAKALELARMLNSEENLLRNAREQYFMGMRATAEADPEFVELGKLYPGLIDALGEATLPLVLVKLRAALPQFWNDLADVLEAGMTLSEIEDCLQFYGSPAGQRMIAALSANLKADRIAADIATNDKALVSAETLGATLQDAVPQVVKGMSTADRLELLKFARKPAFAKVKQLGPRTQALTVDWINGIGFDTDPELLALIEETLIRHMEEADAAAGRTESQSK